MSEKVIQIENLAGISEEEAQRNGISIVGYMLAFTMGECQIPNEIPEKYWEENELDKTYMPRPSKPKGAFKKACMSLKGYREEEGTSNGYRYFSIYDTTRLTDVQYMITRKIIRVSEEDEEQTELEHINLMKLWFNRETKEISYDFEDSRMKAVADDLFEKVFKKNFVIFLTHMTRENIHDAFKRYLKMRNGIPLTIGNGGGWFIPSGKEEEFAKIKAFYNDIANEYRTGLYNIKIRSIPMIDTIDVKEMVEEGVRKKVETEMRNIVETTIDKLQSNDEDIIEKALKLTEKKVNDISGFKRIYEKLLKQRITVNVEIPEGIPQSDRLKAIADAMR